MKAMSHWTVVLTLAVILVTVVVMPNFVRAQPLTTLHSFLDRKRGAEPVAGLIQATNGDFYGTTAIGGENSNSSYGCSQGCGTVFKITPDGGLTLLYSFCSQTDCTDGLGPYAGLIQATNGDFYGTSLYGGQNSNSSYCPQGCGTVFKITPDGTMTRVYSFCSQTDCEDGAEPYAGLIQATDGNFYGTTQGGGMNEAGTVFKITPSGTLTTLYSFCHKTHCKDGATPGSRLLQATDGNFYGTTLNGGTQKSGTVFKISADGRLTTLYSFCSQANCEDGSETDGGLIQATDGNFYGTTASGGAHASGGTVFVITPSGTLNTLYSFCSQGPDCTDGRAPEAALVQATDGNFYGTTAGGGTNGAGTVYELTPSGSLTTLYSFCSQTDCTDGSEPFAGVIQGTDGDLYGTTFAQVAINSRQQQYGTAFSLSVGLNPFVEIQTTSGRVDAAVKILGNNLTGATSVTFNGTVAKFTVISQFEIKTTVPEGATTGFVQVETPSGALTSNVVYTVKP